MFSFSNFWWFCDGKRSLNKTLKYFRGKVNFSSKALDLNSHMYLRITTRLSFKTKLSYSLTSILASGVCKNQRAKTTHGAK